MRPKNEDKKYRRGPKTSHSKLRLMRQPRTGTLPTQAEDGCRRGFQRSKAPSFFEKPSEAKKRKEREAARRRRKTVSKPALVVRPRIVKAFFPSGRGLLCFRPCSPTEGPPIPRPKRDSPSSQVPPNPFGIRPCQAERLGISMRRPALSAIDRVDRVAPFVLRVIPGRRPTP